jgi:S-adenosylmethionine synthetase
VTHMVATSKNELVVPGRVTHYAKINIVTTVTYKLMDIGYSRREISLTYEGWHHYENQAQIIIDLWPIDRTRI